MVILLSPSHRYPVPCDYSKALLFDRCMDYVSQIHQALENPSVLPFLTYLDILRVYQIGHRFATLLSENFDMLLSPVVPALPYVPAGTPEPPMLAEEDRINCCPRAIRCLSYVRDMLKYSQCKWDLRDLLEKFEDESAALNERLMDYSGGYSAEQTPYSQVPLAGNGYSGYQFR